LNTWIHDINITYSCRAQRDTLEYRYSFGFYRMQLNDIQQ